MHTQERDTKTQWLTVDPVSESIAWGENQVYRRRPGSGETSLCASAAHIHHSQQQMAKPSNPNEEQPRAKTLELDVCAVGVVLFFFQLTSRKCETFVRNTCELFLWATHPLESFPPMHAVWPLSHREFKPQNHSVVVVGYLRLWHQENPAVSSIQSSSQTLKFRATGCFFCVAPAFRSTQHSRATWRLSFPYAIPVVVCVTYGWVCPCVGPWQLGDKTYHLFSGACRFWDTAWQSQLSRPEMLLYYKVWKPHLHEPKVHAGLLTRLLCRFFVWSWLFINNKMEKCNGTGWRKISQTC